MFALIIAAATVAGLIVIITIGVFCTKRFVYTPPFRDTNGNIPDGSIAEFRRVRIGDQTQAILVRGKNRSNPVVLFLHAGPCLSETALMRKYNADLEEHFTMVYWDMRGSGKSWFPGSLKTLSTQLLLDDIHEMTTYLKKELGQDRIILLGHSFGGGFAALAAHEYPEDYSVCVISGIAPDPVGINRISYYWVLEQARNDGNGKAVRELEAVSGFWEKMEKKSYFNGMMVEKKWIGHYGGMIVGEKGFVGFVLKNLPGTEYSLFDYIPYMMGMAQGGPASWDILTGTNLFDMTTDFRIPLVLFMGRQDFNAWPPMAEDFYNRVKAPRKELIWFEDSAHFLHIEEAEKFRRIMDEVVRPMAPPAAYPSPSEPR
jgi:pimeloyl-ACP methyl ester carboxylesterase